MLYACCTMYVLYTYSVLVMLAEEDLTDHIVHASTSSQGDENAPLFRGGGVQKSPTVTAVIKYIGI